MPPRPSKSAPPKRSRVSPGRRAPRAGGHGPVGRAPREPAPSPSPSSRGRRSRTPNEPAAIPAGAREAAVRPTGARAVAGGTQGRVTRPAPHHVPFGPDGIVADAAIAAQPTLVRSRGDHDFPEHHQQSADGRLPSDVLVYLRSSSSEQDASVTQQAGLAEADLRAACVLVPHARLPRVHNLDRQVLIDDGVSGWSLTPGERDAGAELLKYCAANRRPADAPGTIWIYALSRFGRFKDGSAAAIAWIFHLYSLGWCLYSHLDGYLGWGRRDRLLKMLQIALKAEKDTSESDDKSEVVRRGKTDRIKGGFWHTGEAPFGYCRCAVRVNDRGEIVEVLEVLSPGKRNAYGTAAPGMGIRTSLERSEAAAWVERMFTWYTHGEAGQPLALRGIAARLNDSGVAATEGALWQVTSVRQVLENDAYIGIQRDRRGVAHTAKWKPLIPQHLFDAAQRRLQENASLGSGRASEYALTGLVVCARCGARYSGHRSQTTQAEHRYYRVRGVPTLRERCSACRSAIPAAVLEARVLELVCGLVTHTAVREAVRHETQRRSARPDDRRRHAELQVEHEAVRRQITNIVELAAIGGAVAAEVRGQLSDLNARAAKLATELTRPSRRAGVAAEASAFVVRASNIHTLFSRATILERKGLVRSFVSRVAIDGQSGSITISVRTLQGQHAERDSAGNP